MVPPLAILDFTLQVLVLDDNVRVQLGAVQVENAEVGTIGCLGICKASLGFGSAALSQRRS